MIEHQPILQLYINQTLGLNINYWFISFYIQLLLLIPTRQTITIWQIDPRIEIG